MDFLSNNSIIDLVHNSISFLKTKQTNNDLFSTEAKLDKDNTSKGEKMLHKMGYVANRGLGKEGQGIKVPIEILGKSDRAGIGFGCRVRSYAQYNSLGDETLVDEVKKLFSMDIFEDAQNL